MSLMRPRPSRTPLLPSSPLRTARISTRSHTAATRSGPARMRAGCRAHLGSASVETSSPPIPYNGPWSSRRSADGATSGALLEEGPRRGLCKFVRIKSSQACAEARSCPSSVRRRRASSQQHNRSTSLRGWRWQHREGSNTRPSPQPLKLRLPRRCRGRFPLFSSTRKRFQSLWR